ncbi:MAG TPA: hypothetical protein VMU14_19600 [Acidimicrobiales bacterium]|nr:hypothetical protein [Acidimicrobiales bacterium]
MAAPLSDDVLAVTAAHEAGHAVLAVWLGVPVVSVDVVPSDEDGTIGHTVCAALPAYVGDWHRAGRPRPVPPRVLDRLERELMIHLAGDMAQAKATGVGHTATVDESRFGSIVVGWDWHMGDVLDAISDHDDDRRARVARLGGITRALLDRGVVWATVSEVTAALTAQRHMTGRRVRDIASRTVGSAWAAAG